MKKLGIQDRLNVLVREGRRLSVAGGKPLASREPIVLATLDGLLL